MHTTVKLTLDKPAVSGLQLRKFNDGYIVIDVNKRAVNGYNYNLLSSKAVLLERDYEAHTVEWMVLRRIIFASPCLRLTYVPAIETNEYCISYDDAEKLAANALGVTSMLDGHVRACQIGYTEAAKSMYSEEAVLEIVKLTIEGQLSVNPKSASEIMRSLKEDKPVIVEVTFLHNTPVNCKFV